jgi:hypothetical protein
LYGEYGGEFAFVNAEHLQERTPGSPEEDGVKLTVVPKEHP